MPVSEQMEVLDKGGKPVSNVYCIGDANGEHSGCQCFADKAVSDKMQHIDPVWLLVRHCRLH